MASIAANSLPLQILDSVRGADVLPVVSETTSVVVDTRPDLHY